MAQLRGEAQDLRLAGAGVADQEQVRAAALVRLLLALVRRLLRGDGRFCLSHRVDLLHLEVVVLLAIVAIVAIAAPLSPPPPPRRSDDRGGARARRLRIPLLRPDSAHDSEGDGHLDDEETIDLRTHARDDGVTRDHLRLPASVRLPEQLKLIYELVRDRLRHTVRRRRRVRNED